MSSILLFAWCLGWGGLAAPDVQTPEANSPSESIRADDTCEVRWGRPWKDEIGFWYVSFSNDCDDAHTGWCNVKHDGGTTRYAAWIPGHQSADVNVGMLADGDEVDCGAD